MHDAQLDAIRQAAQALIKRWDTPVWTGPEGKIHTGELIRDLERAVAAIEPEAGVKDSLTAEPFQQRVQPWLLACFGAVIASDPVERNHRFLEESLELVQACGCTQSEAHQLVDYVFGRPVGEKTQEVGGVMVTLAALCLAQGLDMHAAGETELTRIWTKVEQIRAKQAAKPKHSPLPEAVQSQPEPVALEVPEDCAHLIVYDDAEMKPALFAGTGARDAAVKTFERVSGQWNAHLFVKIKSNSRDDRHSAINARPVQAAQPAVAAPDHWLDEIQKLSEVASTAMNQTPADMRNLLEDIADRLCAVHAAAPGKETPDHSGDVNKMVKP